MSDSNTKWEFLAILFFTPMGWVFMFIVGVIIIGCFNTYHKNNIEQEAIKAGLHQDNQGHWVK